MKLKILLGGIAAIALLMSGCAGDFVEGPYSGPYLGGYGPYYPGYGPFDDGDFIVGGFHYHNHFGGHHFYGRSFGFRHIGGIRGAGGFRVHAFQGGFHRGGFQSRH
jgi:hypothetical protein